MFNGKIKTYNEARGFGFIEIEGEAKDVFFHIKDLPQPHIVPTVGEKVQLNKVTENGKSKAAHIRRLDVQIETVRHTPQSRAMQYKPTVTRTAIKQQPKQQSNWFTSIAVLVIIALGIGIYQKMNTAPQMEALPVQSSAIESKQVVVHNFTCDGRQHCSQMTSRAEAEWFIRNCPNTKMDGDGDGIPCENDSRW